MTSKFETFAALHVPGDPVVLCNIWDVGSANAVAKAGAKALATGSHPVGDAFGFGDGQQVPLDVVLDNSRRIVNAVELPLTVDFEGPDGEVFVRQAMVRFSKQVTSNWSFAVAAGAATGIAVAAFTVGLSIWRGIDCAAGKLCG